MASSEPTTAEDGEEFTISRERISPDVARMMANATGGGGATEHVVQFEDDDAPVTAEGLRERLTKVVTRWALMYPLGNYGIWGTAGASRDQLAGIAEDIAGGWGREIADRVLAELAGDPGDLPARMEAAIVRYFADPPFDVDLASLWRGAAEVAMSARWAHSAWLAAENDYLRRRAEHAETAAALALTALEGADTRCRYHGENPPKAPAWHGGCESCQQPTRVREALAAIRALTTEETGRG